MFVRCAIAAAVFVCASEAGAQMTGFLRDTEPDNNSTETAPVLRRRDSAALTGVFGMTPGDTDYTTIGLDAGAMLTLVTMPLNATMMSPDTVLTVLDENGVPLVSDDDGGSNSTGTDARGSVVRFQAPAAGAYRVRVQGFNGATSGEYAALYVVTPLDFSSQVGSANLIEQLAANDTPETAQALPTPWCGPVAGFFILTPAGDWDYFSVELRAGDLLTAVTTPISGIGSPGNLFTRPDTVLTVFGVDGVTPLVESDDDNATEFPYPGETARGSTVRFRATANGRYFIRVRGYSGATGYGSLALCVIPRSVELCASDVNGDGLVNSVDLALMLGAWGMCP